MGAIAQVDSSSSSTIPECTSRLNTVNKHSVYVVYVPTAHKVHKLPVKNIHLRSEHQAKYMNAQFLHTMYNHKKQENGGW